MVSKSWIYTSLISEKNHVSCSFSLHFSYEKNKHPLMFSRHLHFHFYKLFTFFAHLGGTQQITTVSELPGLCCFENTKQMTFRGLFCFLHKIISGIISSLSESSEQFSSSRVGPFHRPRVNRFCSLLLHQAEKMPGQALLPAPFSLTLPCSVMVAVSIPL